MRKQRSRTEDSFLVYRDLEFIVSFANSISNPWQEACKFRCLQLPNPSKLLFVGSWSGLAAGGSILYLLFDWRLNNFIKEVFSSLCSWEVGIREGWPTGHSCCHCQSWDWPRSAQLSWTYIFYYIYPIHHSLKQGQSEPRLRFSGASGHCVSERTGGR